MEKLLKLLFIPVSVAGGIVAGLIGRKIFELTWGLVDEEDAPHPKHRELRWAKLIPALLVEGAIFRMVRGVVDRGTRVGFARATGSWPGEPGPERK
jgi:hypothetical protein